MKLKKFFFKKVKSTNNTAMRLIRSGIKNGVISSEIQTKGKGQRGNNWISKKEIKTSVKFYGRCDYSNYLKSFL